MLYPIGIIAFEPALFLSGVVIDSIPCCKTSYDFVFMSAERRWDEGFFI